MPSSLGASSRQQNGEAYSSPGQTSLSKSGSTSKSAGTPKTQKKVKTKRACDYCRFMKVQCTLASGDACTRCTGHKIPCTFVQSAPPRRTQQASIKRESDQKQSHTKSRRASQRRDEIAQTPTQDSGPIQARATARVVSLTTGQSTRRSKHSTTRGSKTHSDHSSFNESYMQSPSVDNRICPQGTGLSMHSPHSIGFDGSPAMDYTSSPYDFTFDGHVAGSYDAPFDQQWIYPFPSTETQCMWPSIETSPQGYSSNLACLDSGYSSEQSPMTERQESFSPITSASALASPIEHMSLEELLSVGSLLTRFPDGTDPPMHGGEAELCPSRG